MKTSKFKNRQKSRNRLKVQNLNPCIRYQTKGFFPTVSMMDLFNEINK